MDSNRLGELLDRWHGGDASPAERAELEEALRSDGPSRRALVRFLLLEVHLHSAYKVTTGRQAAVAAARPRRAVLDRVAAAAVIGLTLVAVTVFMLRPKDLTHQVASGPIRVNGVQVTKISDGQWFEVGDQPAVIRLRSGVRIELEPGSWAMPGDGLLELASGGGRFEVGKEAGRFHVGTPKGRVSTAGSGFSVDLMQGRDAFSTLILSVAVKSGAVQVEYGGRNHVVSARESRLFPRPSDGGVYGTMLQEVKLTLPEAIRRAQSSAPEGVVIGAELDDEDGKIVYSIDIAIGGKTLELALDPRTGEVLQSETEDEDNSTAAASVRVPLLQTIETALRRVPGVAVTAELELEKGRPEFEIKIFTDGRITEVKIDGATGEVTRVKEEKKKEREK